ncbi:unnamed protein product [Paramecium sonneborni]|uniref:Uncharacterized protein n=1 Tax=Paramecium sonneborni TaxID=65129 RepID=A0A8S1RSD9_9CILI|nr:unnamed protein product [Paramecium sonneborni]
MNRESPKLIFDINHVIQFYRDSVDKKKTKLWALRSRLLQS